jgi:hypothetical protein
METIIGRMETIIWHMEMTIGRMEMTIGRMETIIGHMEMIICSSRVADPALLGLRRWSVRSLPVGRTSFEQITV